MSISLLSKYGQVIDYTDEDTQSRYRSELGELLSKYLDETFEQTLFGNSSVYLAYKAGITLPHKYNSIKYRQANLDYLAKHHPEYLL